MKIICIILLLSLAGLVNAQRIQTFDLGVPITEQFVGCLEQKDAVELVNSIRQGSRAFQNVSRQKFGTDVCRPLEWTITYHERVYQTKDAQGVLLSVYRGSVGGKTIFVPVAGWTHNVI